jgi:chitodextrinase
MAEFKISRFRYTWKDQWTSAEEYNRDDVVFYQGSSWVCIRQHTADIFSEDLIFVPPGNTEVAPAWVKMTDGQQFDGNWSNNTLYEPGTLVRIGGNIYLCLVSHTSSSTFNLDIINWEVFAVGSNFRNTWETNVRYNVGDVIRYNGYTYQCIFEHVSSDEEDGIVVGIIDAEDNPIFDDSTSEAWKPVVENYYYAGEFQLDVKYKKNDLVKYGGSILKCIFEHTSGTQSLGQ